jgi:hypothetical protein
MSDIKIESGPCVLSDDEKIKNLLLPYLDEMATLDRRFLSEISIRIEFSENESVPVVTISGWLFSSRRQARTLAELMQIWRHWDPIAAERQQKLDKIARLKTELAALEGDFK